VILKSNTGRFIVTKLWDSSKSEVAVSGIGVVWWFLRATPDVLSSPSCGIAARVKLSWRERRMGCLLRCMDSFAKYAWRPCSA